MSPADGADVLGAAGDYEVEKAWYGQYMFPKLFGDIAGQYAKRYGLTERQLAQVAVKNHAHARMNPLAQTRGGLCLTLEAASTESEANPRIAPPLKISDCSQITDGAAAVILCSEGFMQPGALRLRAGGPSDCSGSATRLTTSACGQTRAGVPDGPSGGPAGVPDRRSRRHGVWTASKYTTAFRSRRSSHTKCLASPSPDRGRGSSKLRNGPPGRAGCRDRRRGRRAPLLDPGQRRRRPAGRRHPVGTTGVRQVAEAYLHLTGRAGERQIRGPGGCSASTWVGASRRRS